MHYITRNYLSLTVGDVLNKGKSEEKVFVYLDDTIDIGKEPTPVDPKFKEIHNQIIKKNLKNIKHFAN